MRFERIDRAGGERLFGREEVNRRLSGDEASNRGAFLARLWRLFGAPGLCDGGFSYAIRDRETGLGFEAYSGASGPSYGGDASDRRHLRPVLAAFERLLETTEPMACRIEIDVDIDHGGGGAAIGWRAGKPFERALRRAHDPKRARTYVGCVAAAKVHEDGYGPEAGWSQCLAAVMPEPPTRFRWKRHVITQCFGFVLDEGEPAFMCLVGEIPRTIPFADVPIKKLPALATLWLESFARWKAGRVTVPTRRKTSAVSRTTSRR